MKKTVFDINDLQEMFPFFRSRFGTYFGNLLIKYLCVGKINEIHEDYFHLKGAEFTSAILKDPRINIRYTIHNVEIPDNLPEGAFIIVSNHPTGSIEGIIMIDIFAARRPDFKIMVNGVLTGIGAMDENFIPVKPDSDRQGANLKNINGIRSSFERLRAGHPMGFFPSGAISSYNLRKKKVCDIAWSHSVVRLIRKAGVPVYPVYFDFYNSKFFYWLSKVNWKVRMLRIPAEVFNKRGKSLDIYVREPIPADEITAIADDEELASFLYNKTYGSDFRYERQHTGRETMWPYHTE